MISPFLPTHLKAVFDAKLEGLSRSDTAARAAAISKTYRDGAGSSTIRTEADALAYALEHDVGRKLADPHVTQLKLIDPDRQHRPVDMNLAPDAVDPQSQTRLQ